MLKRHSILLKRINVEIWRCFNVEIWRCFNVEIWRCFNVEIRRCFNVEILRCFAVEIGRWNNAEKGFVILWVYYTIPFCFSLFRHFWVSLFNVLNYFDWLRITDEGSLPEMRIWFILLIKSDLKWCIHLSRSLCLYFTEVKINNVVSTLKVGCSTSRQNNVVCRLYYFCFSLITAFHDFFDIFQPIFLNFCCLTVLDNEKKNQ